MKYSWARDVQKKTFGAAIWCSCAKGKGDLQQNTEKLLLWPCTRVGLHLLSVISFMFFHSTLDTTRHHIAPALAKVSTRSSFSAVIMVAMVWYTPTYLASMTVLQQLLIRSGSGGLPVAIFVWSPKVQIYQRKFLMIWFFRHILLVQVITFFCTSWVAAAQSPKTCQDSTKSKTSK